MIESDVTTATARRHSRCDLRAMMAFLVAAAVLLVSAVSATGAGRTANKTTAAGGGAAAGPTLPVAVGFGRDGLPVNVAEMRDAILAAALTGDLKELMVPVQWNELPPDFGAKPVKETLETWRKASHDGTGREMLALIADILSGPYAVRRQGADIENAKIFIWPAFAELPLDKLTPQLDVALLRLLSVEEVKRMKSAGHYDGYGVAIGADGTWHAFKRVPRPDGTQRK